MQLVGLAGSRLLISGVRAQIVQRLFSRASALEWRAALRATNDDGPPTPLMESSGHG
jgi:hypothetical protein